MKKLAIALIIAILLPFLVAEAGAKQRWVVQRNATASSWLRNVTIQWPRPGGCRFRPSICQRGEHPPGARMRCCGNQCFDLNSDVSHCGLCGLRCPFTWQCCRGICTNTNVSPLNCGRCGNRCEFTAPCLFGMCGYAGPRPPWPFPWPPRPPFPPRPPLPPHPPGCPERPPGRHPPRPPQPPEGHQPPTRELKSG